MENVNDFQYDICIWKYFTFISIPRINKNALIHAKTNNHDNFLNFNLISSVIY